MRKIKGLLILLVGLLFLVACDKSKKVTLEVNPTLTLQVGREVKLVVNHAAKDLEFSGMGDVIAVRTSGDNVYIKGLKEGNVDLKVIYKPNKKITATVKVTVNPQQAEKNYTINFNVLVPEGFSGDVYVLGTFNNWELTNALKLTKGADGKYIGSTTFTTEEETLQYKYFNHNDWPYAEGNEVGGYRDNREALLQTTTDLFDEVLSWEKVYYNQQGNDPKEYTFTFNVVVPEGTNGNVYVVGNFTNWLDEPCTPLELTKGEGNTYSGTIKYTTNQSVAYKYVNAKDLASISWEYEEVIGANRELTLEALTANDTVTAWKKGGYKEGAVEKDYTLKFKVTLPFVLPEGYKVWVVGFNGWNESDALELTANALEYTATTTITTDASQIEYMVLAGKTFTWDHKPLKEDNSEYGFGDNITHVLVDGENIVEYKVHAWKGINETENPEQEYTFTFNVTVPVGTEGNVFVVGNFTNWLLDPSTPLQLTKGEGNTYSGTIKYTTNQPLSYKYVNSKDLASINYDYEEIIEKNRTLTLETLIANDTVTTWKNGGYKETTLEVEYTLTFNVLVPAGTEGNVYVVGSFTNWLNEFYTLQLTKGEGNAYSGSVTYKTAETTVEYKYVNAKDLASLNYDYEEVISTNRVLTLTTPTANDTVSSWKSGGYKELTPPKMVNVVVRLTNIPLSTGTDPIKLIGSMTNDWTKEDALTFVKNGDVYEVTLNIDKNIENKFALYLDKGQATWHDHQASNDGSDVMADHIISAAEYTALLVEIAVPQWKGITPLVEYTLSFTVTVPAETEGNVFVAGSFTNWLLDPSTPLQLTKGEGNTYSGSVKYITSETTVQYKYVNAKDLASISWTYGELSENRTLTLTTPTITDTVTAWENHGYFEPANAAVTFDVTAPVEANVVCVVGPFNNWGEAENTLDWQLSKVGDKYTLTKDFLVSERNFNLQYKYVINGYWENYGGNRTTLLERNTSKTITESTASIGSTMAPATTLPKYTFTFTVTVPEGTQGNVFIAGSFTNWLDTPCTPIELTKGEGNTYTKTVEIRSAYTVVEYKYVNAKTSRPLVGHMEKNILVIEH